MLRVRREKHVRNNTSEYTMNDEINFNDDDDSNVQILNQHAGGIAVEALFASALLGGAMTPRHQLLAMFLGVVNVFLVPVSFWWSYTPEKKQRISGPWDVPTNLG